MDSIDVILILVFVMLVTIAYNIQRNQIKSVEANDMPYTEKPTLPDIDRCYYEREKIYGMPY